ncbi:MAG TPA: response regulator [Pirellulales bacterium]|nr:response regulator [Pirellulales bacterium]
MKGKADSQKTHLKAGVVPRTFIDHLNHEIRSPLTVVVGMAELLSLSSLSEEQRQYLATLRQATDSILRLMDFAVDFSRLQAGSLALRDEPFSLRGVLDQFRQSALSQRPTPALEIEVQPEAQDALRGDGARLRQVLTELVAYLAEVYRIQRISLQVTAGSPASHDARLTFAFVAADRSCPAAEDGEDGQWIACSEDMLNRRHGLELAVAAGLAKAMNGAVWIAAQADAPIAARFTAAFERSVESESLKQLFAPTAAAQSPNSPAPRRILLAEDVKPNQQIIGSLLRRRGHAVSIVSDGAEAVKAFERHPESFDVVILDLEMPVMDGRQAAAEIRRRASERPVLIVALTAHRIDGASKQLLPEHFHAALGKPIDAERLFEAVESDHTRPAPSMACDSATTHEASGEPAAVDYRAALKRLCGDERLLDDLVQFFLDDSPELLCEARAAIERNDAKALERTAHSIRGLASNFGAHSTVQAAAALEQIGHDAELDAAERACQTLEAEIGRLMAVLEDRLKLTRSASLDARGS